MRKLLTMFSLLLGGTIVVLAQQRQITGKITDKNGQPVSGATIQIKGTNSGTSAATDGSFTINAKTGDVLEISAVNFGSISVRVPAGSTIGAIALEFKENVMDEVVVTAGGLIRKKREEGYNATHVTSQGLTQAKPVNIAAGLTGKVAGLQVNAITGGVNPTVRLILRGNRSLLGNNNALVVVDNVIVPNEILGNLNPEDVDDINVLNGAGAAALYGSDASNGAIIITTKKGKSGVNIVKIANTTTLEQVSFYPKLQTEFGSGYQTGAFTPYENQQYGPKFDGTIRQLGRPNLQTGETQMLPYSPNDSREKFWETGITNQSDFSVSSGDDRSTYYISGQYATVQGTTPLDRYNRASIRFNGSRNVVKGVKLSYTANYVQNRYDITTQTGTIFQNLLNTPAWVPLTKYKHWESDFFSSPEGYYNDYYQNPYFYVGNYRQKTRNDYLTGNIELSWAPLSWLSVVYRAGITTRNYSNKSIAGRYTLSDSAYHTGSKSDEAGGVADGMFYSTQINSDLLVSIKKKVKDFRFDLTLGHSLRNNNDKTVNVNVSGLVVPNLFNISNTTSEFPNGSEGNSTSRQLGVFGKLQVAYKTWLFVDMTGRNDWRSVLDPEHRSFFYPSVDVSFIATDAIEALKNSKLINNLKIRGGWSQVGNVNIGPYQLQPTFGQANGFPFAASGPGYTVGNQIVAKGLKPEITSGWEAGFDADLMDRRINAGLTYYSTHTVDQTVPTGVSITSGFSSFLRNTGEVSNKGLEALLHYTPIRGKDWTVTMGGNYTFNDNKVISISSDVPRLALSSGGDAQVYAVPGYAFPILLGTDYVRDDQGRVIVDRITGYPTLDPTIKPLGNTQPKHRLGLDLEVKYKALRLWVLAEYRGGYYTYHDEGQLMDFSGSSIRTVAFNRDRFVFPNSVYEDPSRPGVYIPNTTVTVRDGGSGFWADGDGEYNMDEATNYVIKGDFWKIREISLSYDFPRSILAKTKYIKGATISLQGRNLFLFVPKSNIYTDPEFNFSDTNAIGITTLSQSPPSRYYGATISLTF